MALLPLSLFQNRVSNEQIKRKLEKNIASIRESQRRIQEKSEKFNNKLSKSEIRKLNRLKHEERIFSSQNDLFMTT